ncbi:MAG TPA: hypothetical protein VMR92_12130, partial [Gemmatimonadales bacterium]|nr:hypothetical protein [Gemmatimonadales bacterium]
MISINSRGDFCHGVGGGYFNVNNVQIRPGGSGGWIDDDFAALADGTDDWKVAVYYMPTGRVTRGHPEYPNGVVTTDIKAGGGIYASWPGVGGVLASTGWTYPDSGLLGVGPDGALAYKPSYQSGGPSMVRERDGSEWQLTPNHPYDLQLLGQRRALWNDTVLGFTVLGIPMPQRLPGANWFPHAFLLEDQWWFGCQNEYCGVVAHPFDNPRRGYVIVPTGNAWPAFRALDRYTLLCVWSNSEAEQAGQLTPRRFDVRTDPLVDIIVPPPIPHADAPHADAPPPVLPAPKVTVLAWDPLMKAGVPWHVKFKTGPEPLTTVDVSKNAKDQLVIAAWNEADTDTTGTVRQLTVEGPTPEPPIPPEPPEPPMRVTARCWMHPNIGSTDLLALFDDVTQLAGVEMFGLYVQQILTDETNSQLGPNTWPNLVAHDVVRKLAEAGVDLRVEMGCVKQGDCQAQGNIAGMQTMLQRVADAGGHVATISLDEPLTANQQFCGGNLATCADAHAAFDHSVKAIDPSVTVGWVEAWPEVDLDDWVTYLALLADRNALPSYVLPDVDHHRAENERKNVARFLGELQRLCDQYEITLGVLVNATVDPLPTDAAHYQNLVALGDTLHGMLPDAAHVVVQSWANRTGGTQDIPHNLGTFGMLATFAAVREQFVGTPIPPDSGDSMLYATLIEPTKERGPVVVKEVKPVQ